MKFIRLLLFLVFCYIPHSSYSQNSFKGEFTGLMPDSLNSNLLRIVKFDSTLDIEYLTSIPQKCNYSAISPDGKRIVYGIIRDTVITDSIDLPFKNLENFSDIYDDSEFPKPLENGSGYIFKFVDLWIMNTDGSGRRMLSGSNKLTWNYQYAWNPDNNKIAYISYRPYGLTKGEIWEMDVLTGEETKIEIDPGKYNKKNIDYQLVKYSPDGRYIIFTEYVGFDKKANIYIKDLLLNKVYLYLKEEDICNDIFWSPDGKRILFNFRDKPLIIVQRTDRTANFGILGMVKDNPFLKDVESYDNCTWSPDGKEIAINITINGKQELWICDNNFENFRQIKKEFDLGSFHWCGYERAAPEKEIKISYLEVVSPRFYQLFLQASVIFVVLLLWIIYRSYKRLSGRLHIVVCIAAAGILLFYFRNSGLLIETLFLFTSIILLWFGNVSGRYMRIEVERNRKELLIDLLEFGHSGVAGRNLSQISFYLNNVIDNGHVDLYYKKRLLESISLFKRSSGKSIRNLYRAAKLSLFYKEGMYIKKELKAFIRIIRSSDEVNIEKSKGIDISGSVDALSRSIKNLEDRVNNYYSCPVVGIIKQTIKSFDEILQKNGIPPVRFQTNDMPKTNAFIKESDLEFILENLISNAVKTVGSSADKVISVNAESTQTRVYIRVADSGKGIPKDKWETVFYPGYSESGGTGYGLYRSTEILVNYKGILKVESSNPEVGTTFLLILRIPETN